VIATGESNSLEAFVASVFDQLDLDWHQHVIQDPLLFRPSEIRYNCGNASKAKQILDWEAKKRMQDVIREMIQFELQVLELNK